VSTLTLNPNPNSNPNPTRKKADRLQQEQYWLDILKTFYPNGLNKYPLEKY